MNRAIKLEGVVIGSRNFSESDKVITLLTKENGKYQALAKGVRKINSRRLGSLELGNLVKILLHQGKTFAIITEVDILDGTLDFREAEAKLNTLFYICELANRLLPENQTETEIYEKFLKIRRLIRRGELEKIVFFEASLLKNLGYGIDKEETKLLKKDQYRLAHQKLSQRIEEIIEKKLKSLDIFK